MQIGASIFALFVDNKTISLSVEKEETVGDEASFNSIVRLMRMLGERSTEEDGNRNTNAEALSPGEKMHIEDVRPAGIFEVVATEGREVDMAPLKKVGTHSMEARGETTRDVKTERDYKLHTEKLYAPRKGDDRPQEEPVPSLHSLKTDSPVEENSEGIHPSWRYTKEDAIGPHSDGLADKKVEPSLEVAEEKGSSESGHRSIQDTGVRQEAGSRMDRRVERDGVEPGHRHPVENTRLEKGTPDHTARDDRDGEPTRHQGTAHTAGRIGHAGVVEFSVEASGSEDTPLLPRDYVRSEVLDKLSGHITKVDMKGGRAEARLVLNPPELGRLRIEIEVKNTKVETRILVEHQLVKDVLDQEVARLRELFLQQGMILERYTVETTTGWSAHREAGRNNAWPPRRPVAKEDSVEESGTDTDKPIHRIHHGFSEEGNISVFA